MPDVPKLSGRPVAKAFGRRGWELVRQKGSHMILVKDGSWTPSQCPITSRLRPARCAA